MNVNSENVLIVGTLFSMFSVMIGAVIHLTFKMTAFMTNVNDRLSSVEKTIKDLRIGRYSD